MLNLPDLNRLKVFYYIFATQSVAGAAKELCITQSAVSQQLKKLEEEIKTKLFTRLHKRLIPTPEAQNLFSILEPFFLDLGIGLRAIRQAKDRPSGELRVGAPNEFGIRYLPKIFATFRENYQEVNFTLHLGEALKMLGMLDRGEIDFAIIDEYLIQQLRTEDLSHFSFERIIDEEVILAGSKEYCAARFEEEFALDELIKQDYISYRHDVLILTNWFKYHFSKLSLELNIVLTTDNQQAVINGIKNHIGLGVVASHHVYDDIQQGKIVPITTAKDAIVNRMSLVQIQDKIPSLTDKVFQAHFKEEIQQTSVLKEFSKITSHDET